LFLEIPIKVLYAPFTSLMRVTWPTNTTKSIKLSHIFIAAGHVGIRTD
jgi:hypothetical protein